MDEFDFHSGRREVIMIDMEQVKVTPRDQQVLNLLVQGCSNKEIAGQLNISPRTVKQHLRTLFLRAGIREGRKPLVDVRDGVRSTIGCLRMLESARSLSPTQIDINAICE